jgi:hypothetical protein
LGEEVSDPSVEDEKATEGAAAGLTTSTIVEDACSGTVLVGVPHHEGKWPEALGQPPLYDSTR